MMNLRDKSVETIKQASIPKWMSVFFIIILLHFGYLLATRYRHQHVGEIKSLSRFKHRTFFRSPCGNRIVVLRLSVAHDMFREYG